MKNKLFEAALLSVVVFVMTACSTKNEESGAPVIDKEQIKKEIQAKEDEFAAVYNTKEFKTIGYYADDATVFAQNRAPLVGKEKIIEYLKEGVASSPQGNTLSFV